MYWGYVWAPRFPFPISYDQGLGELALKLAQEETDSALEQVGPGFRPSRSVTVRAVVASARRGAAESGR